MPRVKKTIDRIGQRIEKLIVIKRLANKIEIAKSGKKSVRACWLCKCDCGNEIVVTSHSLNKALLGKGGTSSCGCLLGKTIKHGKCGTKAYKSWHMMLQRCTNANNAAYKSYGGRGIKVCDEWKNFMNFFADMGEPLEGCTLDRIDNELGYSKDNCRWATKKQQGNNRRTNLYIVFNGKKQTLSEWADELNLSRYCLRNRLLSGWTVEKALTTPNHRN